MHSENFVIEQIKQQAILPLFYHDDATVCIKISEALYTAGIKSIEFTNRGVHALQNFKELLQWRDEAAKDLLLGVGTIKSSEDANKFIDAGADFLVSPIFENSICDVAYMNKILWIPGCMTPTEIHTAQTAGCSLIKLFPGNLLQPSFVEAIMPLFRGLDFIVTGGVDTTEVNIKSWFDAGVAGVGMGSKLISKAVIQNSAFDELKNKTAEILKIVAAYKKN